jgi:hypothetical protein
MSKADTLLKKATVFERLALYSDRKAFLGALAQNSARIPQVIAAGVQVWIDPASGLAYDAQTGGNQVDGKTGQPVKAATNRSFFFKTLAQGAGRIPQVTNGGVQVWIDPNTSVAYDSQTGGNPVNARTGQPIQAGPLKSLIPQVRMGPQGAYNDNFNPNTGVFTSQEEGGMAPTPAGSIPDRDSFLGFQRQVNAPAVPEKGQAPSHSSYPSIDKRQQAALFRDLTTRGLGFFDPTDADGKLGPQTRQAIDLYKKNFFANKPNATDAEVLRAVSTSAKPASYTA